MHRAPPISYVICGTPRAGTGFLGGLLANTGVAGQPEEYLWDQDVWGERWETTSVVAFLGAMLEQGTSRNGVFGLKVMWSYLDGVLQTLRTLPGADAGMRDRELLELALPGLRYVFVRRDDVVAQAVSHLRAIQTGVWYAGDTRSEPKQPHFDFEMIHDIAQETALHNGEWRRWFDRQGISPFEVRYEHLVREPRATIVELVGWLGIPAAGNVPVVERWPKQADALNDEWARRYRSIAGSV